MYEIPILLLAYNRPSKLAALVKKLRPLKPRTLYVSIDGPKTPDAAAVGGECIAALAGIDWGCEIHIQRLAHNQGLAVGPARGISWMLAQEEFGIILEDDIDPRPEFFEYCRHAADEYRFDARVGAVSGNNFTDERYDFWNGQCGLSRYFFGWGWATWRDRWQHFNVHGDHLASFVHTENAILSMVYNDEALAQRWKLIFERWRNGGTWDYIWQIHMWKHGYETLIPPVNLTANVGVGQDATNTTEELTFMADWRKGWNRPLPASWKRGAVKSEIGDKFNNAVRNLGSPASTLSLQT